MLQAVLTQHQMYPNFVKKIGISDAECALKTVLMDFDNGDFER